MRRSTISKTSIKNSFSKASSSYDRFSIVQKEVNRRLLSLVPDRAFDKALEIGCGTGGFTGMLLKQKKVRRIVGVDISYEMLAETRRNLGAHYWEFCHLLCGDGERLPIRPQNAFDLIVSASCMHWFEDFGPSFSSVVEGHLKRDGYLACAVFGEDTLVELQDVIGRISKETPVRLPSSNFPTPSGVTSVLSDCLGDFELQEVRIESNYDNLFDLIISLKRTGTAPRTGRELLLGSRRKILAAESLYRQIYGSVRASFQVILFSGKASRAYSS